MIPARDGPAGGDVRRAVWTAGKMRANAGSGATERKERRRAATGGAARRACDATPGDVPVRPTRLMLGRSSGGPGSDASARWHWCGRRLQKLAPPANHTDAAHVVPWLSRVVALDPL